MGALYRPGAEVQAKSTFDRTVCLETTCHTSLAASPDSAQLAVPGWVSDNVSFVSLCFDCEYFRAWRGRSAQVFTHWVVGRLTCSKHDATKRRCGENRAFLSQSHPSNIMPSPSSPLCASEQRCVDQQSVSTSAALAPRVADSGVRETAAGPRQSQASRDRASEPPRPVANTRASSMQRYLNAQTNVDQEVLQLYKLVCRG